MVKILHSWAVIKKPKTNNEIKIAVIDGGSSPERNVSLAGGCNVASSLRECGYEVIVVDPFSGRLCQDEENRYLSTEIGTMCQTDVELKKFTKHEKWANLVQSQDIKNCDLVFPVMHGKDGEDGKLQVLLDLMKIPYVGSNHTASGIAMDKDLTKKVFHFGKIATPAWLVFEKNKILNFSYPIIVKPSKTGSTVGVQFINSESELDAAIENAKFFDEEILLEEYINGREFTVGIALEVGEIKYETKIFDYHCKYTPGISQKIFPAQISESLSKSGRFQGSCRVM